MGTSYGDIVLYSLPWDHPHAYGDKYTLGFPIFTRGGSSPRVWGQDYRLRRYTITYGIIPTRVGTSLASLTEQHNIQDHPHACGDKACLKLSCDNIKGSSPRVWGQVRHGLRINSRNGIIPTRVGTSLFPLVSYHISQDHPHACGDK